MIKVVLWGGNVRRAIERKGAKGLPGKTREKYVVSRSSCGHWNSITSTAIDMIVVSTDDEDLSEAVLRVGLDVAVARLAGDDVPNGVAGFIGKANLVGAIKAIVDLDCTCPVSVGYRQRSKFIQTGKS